MKIPINKTELGENCHIEQGFVSKKSEIVYNILIFQGKTVCFLGEGVILIAKAFEKYIPNDNLIYLRKVKKGDFRDIFKEIYKKYLVTIK